MKESPMQDYEEETIRAAVVANVHRSPSVGSIVKKMLEIDPEIPAKELMALVRRATRTQGAEAGDFAQIEVVDEKLAMELVRARVARNGPNGSSGS